MSSPRNGILATGNWIVDRIKIIDSYPLQDALGNILEEDFGNGGSPYNLLVDLAKLGANFPLEAAGLIGNDENGRLILADCQAHGIDTRGLQIHPTAPTSYTDVMTVKSTGRRTFFHNRGSNAYLSPAHIQLEQSNARLFHMGYLLLLDEMDRILGKGQTVAAQVFKQASELGFLTSTDIVSESSTRFASIIPPALPYIDFLFCNEYEAERITGIAISDGGYIDLEKAEDAAIALLGMGVRRWVILHFPKGALAINKQVGSVFQPSIQFPPEKVAGAAGAGDAFAAGVIFGLHQDWDMQQALALGVSAAAASLTHPTCSRGVPSVAQALALGERYGFWAPN